MARDALTTAAPEQSEADTARGWSEWGRPAFARLPLPGNVTITILAVILIAAQLLEYLQRDTAGQYRQPLILARHLALPALTLYMLLMLRVLKKRAAVSLKELQSAIDIPAAEYDTHVRRMLRTDARLTMLLLGISAIITVVWLGVLQGALPFNPIPQLGRSFLSANIPTGTLTLISYIVFGWAGLELVLATLQLGRGLTKLAEYPLRVNVFDPTNLLPFGGLALLHSVSVAGVIVGLLVLLGQPKFVLDYVVVAIGSLTSSLALVMPLMGVRKHMLRAKHAALAHIHERLSDCQTALLAITELSPDTVKSLTLATDNLISLRKTILAQPSWPFRNGLAVFRVSLAALTPVGYFLLNEVVRAYVLPALIVK
jgi:hypothetical protein